MESIFSGQPGMENMLFAVPSNGTKIPSLRATCGLNYGDDTAPDTAHMLQCGMGLGCGGDSGQRAEGLRARL